jgi:hypothetical protein
MVERLQEEGAKVTVHGAVGEIVISFLKVDIIINL